MLEEARFREEVSVLSRGGKRATKPHKGTEGEENGRGDVEDLGRAVHIAPEFPKGAQGPGDYLWALAGPGPLWPLPPR